jgi:hypothetical protein
MKKKRRRVPDSTGINPRSRATILLRPAVAALLALGLAVRLLVAWQPLEFHAAKGAIIDDAFYSLNIARHLAGGEGLTFDGENPTNGFQPLYVFIMAPVFRLFPADRILPVHVALTILALAGAATGLFIFRIAKRRWGADAGIFALALYAFSPYAVESCQNGLETAIVGLLWMAVLDHYLGRLQPGESTLSDRLILASLLALAVFTRIDGGILAVAVAADYLIFTNRPLKVRFREIALIAAVVLLIYLPWAAFNLFRFGSVLPRSGEAVRFLAQCFGDWGMSVKIEPFDPGHPPLKFFLGNLIYSMGSLYRGQLFFPASPLAYYLNLFFEGGGAESVFSQVVIVACLASGIALSRYRERGLDVVFISLGLMVAAYSFYAFGNWFFHRYYYPVSLGLLLLGAGIFHRLWNRLRAEFRLWAAIGLAVLFAIIFYRTSQISFGVATDDKIQIYLEAARELNKTVPPEGRVGVFQAGTMGYFSDRKVINLDGVVNHEALVALEDRKLLAYLRRQKIDYVTDHAAIIQMLFKRGLTPGEEKAFGVLSPPGSKVILLRVRPETPYLLR